jgi:beta-glucanase (GH16 family)
VEGNGGQSNFELNVKLDVTSSKAVTVHYRTNDGTAKANEDYIAIADATLTFAANETQKKIVVTVLADDLKEADEVFTVVLSAPGNASLAKSGANITIKNDDTRVDIPGDGYDAPTSYAGYTLAWSDEFNGDALNTASWAHQNGDGCPNLCGWGNNELEYYTERPDNLYFQDGKMIIEAKQENYNGKPYTSSKILTAGKQAFKFGRIDIRAKLPKGKGIWPAFWLLPQDNVYGGWPRSGEIDLMEMVGHEPNKVYGTLHFGPGPGSTQISRGYTLPSGNFNDAFHVFSLEWRQDQLKWYVDGNLFSTVNKADLGANNYPFNEKFYLIFNLAVGGNWPGNPDASTQFPQRMIVDYIRLYQ